jgi:hypothetical protein
MKHCKLLLVVVTNLILQHVISALPVGEVVFPSLDCKAGEIFIPGKEACEPLAVALMPKNNTSITKTNTSIINEAVCFESGRLFFNGRCYWPATQGPCGDEEWLVLIDDPKTKSSKASCQRRPCLKKEIPMNGGLCVSLLLGKESICGEKEMLVTNPFGQGNCICNRNPMHLKWQKDNKCYELYRRGPCGFSEYLIANLDVSGTASPTACVPNNCTVDGAVWFQGKCRQLGDICPETSLSIGVNDSSFQLDCIEIVKGSFPSAPPCTSSSHNVYSKFCGAVIFGPRSDDSQELVSSTGTDL